MRAMEGLVGAVGLLGVGCSVASPPPDGGSTTAPTTSTSTGTGTTDATDATGETAASTGAEACNDAVLTPADDPFQTCSNLGPVCAPICDQATAGMKAAIAGRTIKCLANECDCPTDVAVCTAKSTACVLETLGTACEDTTADASCEQVVAVCGGDLERCHDLVDGLADAARANVMSCALEDCADGLESCVVTTLIP
jgi:hypothetical protein